MKRNHTHRLAKYSAPQVEVVEMSAEHITMASQLDDYEDNPIFGSPKHGGMAVRYYEDWDD